MNKRQLTSLLLKKPQARLELASVDIQFFAEYYLAKYFNFPTPQFHIDWIDYFTNYDRVALACPRGSAKTTWWSLVFPLWCILFQKKHFIVLFSDTKDQANGFLGSIIEELETNETIIRDFGKIAGYIPPTAQEKRKWTMNEIITTTNIKVSAFGFGSKVRGLKHLASRPDLIVLDDVENDQSVQSAEQREKYKNIFRKSILNLGDEKTQYVVVGTILHFDSLLQSILSNPPKGYITKKYQILANEQSLWPERWTVEDIEMKKDEIGTIAWEQEYQNNPLSLGSQILQIKKFYTQLPEQLTKFAYVDLAISEKETADYTAFCTIGIDQNKLAYVIDPVQFKGDVYQQLEMLFAYFLKHKHLKIGIESVAYQKVFYQLVMNEGNKRGLRMPVVEVKVIKDKIMRAKGASVYLENGTIQFNAQHEAFNFQIQQFPMASHDDMVDSLVGAMEVAGITRSKQIYVGFG